MRPQATRVAASITVPIVIGADATVDAQFVSFDHPTDAGEHFALDFRPESDPAQPVLVRVHSECVTGDLFYSLRCDCGPQLREAVTRLQTTGGVLVYLRQEGRGIGLRNKLKAYGLQDTGMDTFAANAALGLPIDSRDYTVAADMLRAMGVESLRLLTNNPEKVRDLRQAGLSVADHETTGYFANPLNQAYLNAKRDISGHLLGPVELPRKVS